LKESFLSVKSKCLKVFSSLGKKCLKVRVSNLVSGSMLLIIVLPLRLYVPCIG
jgi:hypothetical protein